MRRLKDRMWRMNNLYFIVDKKGEKVRFKANWAQQVLLRQMHYMNIILKARQLGMTTFICIFFLDVALFNSNTECGIIAHNKDDAEKFFNKKVKFAYDNLPEEIKQIKPANTDTAKSLGFPNGSAIYVGTSMRSGTLQYLHISEHGKICAKYPKKAEEIRTGALNTVDAGQYIFIESTAEGRAGDFYTYTMKAYNKMLAETDLTPLDFKYFFFPWHHHPDYVLRNVNENLPTEMQDYFEELETKFNIILSHEQQMWYLKKWELQQDKMKQEYPSTPEEAFEASVIGAYWAKQMTRAREEKRIGRVPVDESVPVHTAWDLGLRDYMAIWFFQVVDREIHIVDYLKSSEEGWDYYVRQLMKKDYMYGQHFPPHDINERVLDRHASRRIELARDAGIDFEPALDKWGIQTGIEVARGMFSRMWFDAEHCDEGLLGLDMYRKDIDPTTGIYRDVPRHDEASHPGSAFRYLCQAVDQGLVVNYHNPAGYEKLRNAYLAIKGSVDI